MTTPLRSVGRDTLTAALWFWVIVSGVFLAGRWHLPAEFPGRLIDRAAAAPTDDPVVEPTDRFAPLRTQLTALGSPGAAVVIAGAVEVHAVLDSVEPLTDPCIGCLVQIAGEPREIRAGDPVQVGVRYWEGSTVVSITAGGAAIDQPVTDLRVSINAAGKVFFGRQCSLVMERSSHAVYRTAVQGESAEFLELRSFAGRLECALAENSTTGEAVTLAAVFSYELPQVGH